MLKKLIHSFKHVSIALAAIATIGSTLLWASGKVEAASRLKDILEFEGVRENMLVGYGLVVGLNNTGDTLKTRQDKTRPDKTARDAQINLKTSKLTEFSMLFIYF